MSEDQALLAKIGQLAGQINRHKNQRELAPGSPSSSSTGHQGQHPYHSSNYQNSTRGRGTPSWRPPIRAAYTRTRFRGRGGRVAPVAYSHRTLVVNNNKPVSGSTSPTIATASSVSSFGTESINAALPSPTSVPVPGSSLPAQQKSTAWVAKRAPGAVQLINSSIFGQQAQAKAKERLRRREEKDKLKMKSWMQKSRGPTYGGLASNTNQTPYEVIISGERYRVAANGSKLEKISGEDDPKAAKSTPKKAVVGGVNFVRSKNGNLWRAGLVKASRQSTNTRGLKINKPCKYFSNTGQCKYGMSCPYTHDAHKVAICPRFLKNDSCPDGDSCDLSHDAKPHRVPACLHFGYGNCQKDQCLYAHVKVNPAAPICRPFATYGYCDKGAECTERHVRDCPDFDEKGVCNDKSCKLSHVQKAGRRRVIEKAAAAAASAHRSSVEEDKDSEESDISSEEEGEEINSDDVDSDAFSDDDFLSKDDTPHEVTMQQDFIHF
ncbi:uncharacterized protein H6S33_002162 [Morchella sextelata]|uniref:uncharacterized protein n=1 Tax=Morchella sextelata TaxID=1174677 RepID=UPI001D04A15C|nr:uncharacterized protein H6S33_002162 [Morchella sextelata]KAH0608110.1 hypothetical protein H6S33_002162 [Morchella sextelata]